MTLLQHIETVHEQKQYQCETCFEFFKSKHTLQQHIAFEHQGKEMLECPTCNKKFKAKSTLEKHISFVHQKELQTTYLCPHCAKSFIDTTVLNKHIKMVHENVSKIVQVLVCIRMLLLA